MDMSAETDQPTYPAPLLAFNGLWQSVLFAGRYFSEHAVGGSHAYRIDPAHRLADHRRYRRQPAPLLHRF
jgi:hypothetical protein